MKSIRKIFVAAAIVIGLSSAVVNRIQACSGCEFSQQYYKSSGSYYPANGYGYLYDCEDMPFVCTYWRPFPITQPNHYLPCRDGMYVIIPE